MPLIHDPPTSSGTGNPVNGMATKPPNDLTVQDIPHHNKHFYYDDLSVADPGTIRLIAIQPGLFTDALVCGLHTKPSLLHQRQHAFDALSYSWSEEPGWKSITLNQHNDFRIGKSLFSALRRLRHRENERWVWSDQICINQANVEEKNTQVSMMGDVYGCADSVYVWLGSCGNTNRAAGEEEVESCHAHVLHDDGTVDFPVKKGLHVVQLCEARIDDKSQWWWRMWIVQEFALAKAVRVMIGPHTFTSMVAVVAALEKSWIDLEPDHVSRNMTKRQWQALPDRKARRQAYLKLLFLHNVRTQRIWLGANLKYLLFHTAEQYAGVPKDKIYGLVSLIDRQQSGFTLEVQYQKSDEEVYTDVTEYLLRRENSLDVLGQTPPPWMDTATWAQQSTSYDKLKCCAGGGVVANVRREGARLLVHGIRLCSVTSVLEWKTYYIIVKENDETSTVCVEDIRDGIIKTYSHQDEEVDASDRLGTMMLRWLEDFYLQKKKEQCLPTYASVDHTEQFARSITADSYLYKSTNTNAKKMAATNVFAPYLSGFMEHKKTWEFRCEALISRTNRAFFTTDAGLCGVAASTAIRTGDIVVVLAGASMPLILRPTAEVDDGGDLSYQLLGECFMSGVMHVFL
ncbi:HET-domain-containing protein [Decorospora gaudefroyi]|uniref:HET-domain-containing protein n=1 Tax=Decorospora gaudefroyi TaxID=184978 RepID=A0A6A5KI44_9PLEO|nr:HET-domain-containing protein [Decorospora gaudefroyi]